MANRRDFLKKTTMFGALAALPLASTVSGSETAAEELDETSSDIEAYNIRARYLRRMDALPPPRVITVPDVEGFMVLKGDFHMHTLFSDGRVMPTDRVDEAVDNGMDVIAITEHLENQRYFGGNSKLFRLAENNDNHNKSYDYAKPYADEKNLLLVRGGEVTKKMPPGHFNTLFVEDLNPIAAVKKDWRKMLRAASDQGAFILWNHPGWERPGAALEFNEPIRFLKEHVEIWENGWMHGIEVYNNDFFPIVSDWCNERDLALFANSDAHQSEWILFGHQNPQRPVTLVLAKERTLESIKEALFAKRTIACAGGMVWGRDPWLPALAKACIDVEFIAPGRMQLTNKSSLPCTVRAGGLIRDLPKDAPRQIDRTKGTANLTFENWLIATNKPLQVPIKAWPYKVGNLAAAWYLQDLAENPS